MIKWRFPANGSAILSSIGILKNEVIAVAERRGYAAYGPYLEVPVGTLSARIILEGEAQGVVFLEIVSNFGEKRWAGKEFDLDRLSVPLLNIDAILDEEVSDLEVRLLCVDNVTLNISRLEIDLEQAPTSWPPERDRPVGTESRKSYAEKLADGFLDRYLSGETVLELGFKGYFDETVPIVPRAIGVDVGYPGYDGTYLPFEDESFDCVYSSHCLEHISNYRDSIKDWYRLIRVGGFIVIVVPHQYLYERRQNLPSPFNPDHKRFYTPRSLIREIEEVIPVNSYRIRHLSENDKDYDYDIPPGMPPFGCFDLEIVIEKIKTPFWRLDDHTVRAYAPSEFATTGIRRDPWAIDIDLANSTHCSIWGPYVRLAEGKYAADFYFKTNVDPEALMNLECEVAQDMGAIASTVLSDRVRGLDDDLDYVTVNFENTMADHVHEFRFRRTDDNLEGFVKFCGVRLRWTKN